METKTEVAAVVDEIKSLRTRTISLNSHALFAVTGRDAEIEAEFSQKLKFAKSPQARAEICSDFEKAIRARREQAASQLPVTAPTSRRP